MELSLFLRYVISEGGAGAIAYLLMANVPYLQGLSAKWKRVTAFALSAALAGVAYVASAYLGYVAMPGTGQAWVESLFAVGTGAFLVSQAIHIKDLGKVARTQFGA